MNFKARYLEMLRTEFRERALTNPAYSMGAFARDMGLQSSRLPSLFRGEQGLSEKKARTMCEKLSWSNEEKEIFCELVIAGSARSQRSRDQARMRLRQRVDRAYQNISDPGFNRIYRWFYFAFLQLTLLKEFKKDRKWIAQRMSLKQNEVDEMINVLVEIEMIDPDSWKATNTRLASSDGVTSRSVRSLSKQVVEKAKVAIDEQKIEDRHISTITVGVAKEKLPDIFNYLSKMRDELNHYLSSMSETNEADEIYCFSSQFFNLIPKKTDEVKND